MLSCGSRHELESREIFLNKSWETYKVLTGSGHVEPCMTVFAGSHRGGAYATGAVFGSSEVKG